MKKTALVTGGSEVLDGVDFGGVHDGLIVW